MAAGLLQLRQELEAARQEAAAARAAAEQASARAQAVEEAALRPGGRAAGHGAAADVNNTLKMVGEPENYDGTHAKWCDWSTVFGDVRQRERTVHSKGVRRGKEVRGAGPQRGRIGGPRTGEPAAALLADPDVPGSRLECASECRRRRLFGGVEAAEHEVRPEHHQPLRWAAHGAPSLRFHGRGAGQYRDVRA